ncbi:copper resistance protein CopC [Undibacterium arcticum]
MPGWLFVSEVAWAHAKLQNATPASGATLESPPREISLHFNEKLEGAFSSVKVTTSAGQKHWCSHVTSRLSQAFHTKA